jgi:hypothetical protein
MDARVYVLDLLGGGIQLHGASSATAEGTLDGVGGARRACTLMPAGRRGILVGAGVGAVASLALLTRPTHARLVLAHYRTPMDRCSPTTSRARAEGARQASVAINALVARSQVRCAGWEDWHGQEEVVVPSGMLSFGEPQRPGLCASAAACA